MAVRQRVRTAVNMCARPEDGSTVAQRDTRKRDGERYAGLPILVQGLFQRPQRLYLQGLPGAKLWQQVNATRHLARPIRGSSQGRQLDFHAAVLRPTLRRVIAGDRACLAKTGYRETLLVDPLPREEFAIARARRCDRSKLPCSDPFEFV